jgi:drug/metabolite transporter (DMT)-like permease
MKYFLLCLLQVVVLVCGQLLFKLAAHDKQVSSINDMAKLIVSRYVIIAVFLYGLGVFLWVYILTKVPLSFAYPIQVLAFPLVLIFSIFLFQESIPLYRWVGIIVIILGVIIASR